MWNAVARLFATAAVVTAAVVTPSRSQLPDVAVVATAAFVMP